MKQYLKIGGFALLALLTAGLIATGGAAAEVLEEGYDVNETEELEIEVQMTDDTAIDAAEVDIEVLDSETGDVLNSSTYVVEEDVGYSEWINESYSYQEDVTVDVQVTGNYNEIDGEPQVFIDVVDAGPVGVLPGMTTEQSLGLLVVLALGGGAYWYYQDN